MCKGHTSRCRFHLNSWHRINFYSKFSNFLTAPANVVLLAMRAK
jgi:hypothetical protein